MYTVSGEIIKKHTGFLLIQKYNNKASKTEYTTQNYT